LSFDASCGSERAVHDADIDLSASLKRCQGTTNIIEHPLLSALQWVNRFKNWLSGEMAARWIAVSVDASSKALPRVIGYKFRWNLKTNLNASSDQEMIDSEV